MNNASITRALLAAAAGAIFLLERRRPLRAQLDPTRARVARNAAVGAITGATVGMLERPVTARLTRLAMQRRWGIVSRMHAPPIVRQMLAVALMDYTLYLWHVLLHRVPFLWRCHAAHHADVDLDASTALRFHVLEFIASIPWRAAQITLIGVTPRVFAAWQQLTAAEVLFHHSNIRVPPRVERWLGAAVMTPRLHGLHHSVVAAERNSNYSSGLTVWDMLHGTHRPFRAGQRVTIGLPEYRNPDALTLGATLLLPITPAAAMSAPDEESALQQRVQV